ncbi:MAG: M48 family metalloprotease [Candidatus Dependentiae bacterium]|jgi:Zn-dependent protease with chaperone function
MKKSFFAAVFLLALSMSVSAELPSTTQCRDEWHAAKNNSHSLVSAQRQQAERGSVHDVQYDLNILFWRLALCKRLAELPEGADARWDLSFQQLMQYADVSVLLSNGMFQHTSHGKPFYYAVSRDEMPALYDIAESMAKTFKVAHPLVAIAEHSRMGTAWVVGGAGALSLLVVGSGLLEMTDDQGLEGILAHEFAHIERNHPLQKGALPILLLFIFILLFGFGLWRLGLYLGFVEESLYGFGLLIVFVIACEGRGLITHMVQCVQPLHSRFIERDADRRACELHAPATEQLIRAFAALKERLDESLAVRKAGYEAARTMIKDDESLSKHVRNVLLKFIDGLEVIAEKEFIKRQSSHPRLEERIETLKKYFDIERKQSES